MQINLNGSFDLVASLSNSLAFLTDPKKLNSCVSNLKEAKFIDDRTFETVFVVKIGPINGNFDAKCKIEPSPPDKITITIDGSGAASSMHLILSLKLSKKSDKLTNVDWNATAEINGIVSGLGDTVLRGISGSKIEEIINTLKSKVV